MDDGARLRVRGRHPAVRARLAAAALVAALPTTVLPSPPPIAAAAETSGAKARPTVRPRPEGGCEARNRDTAAAVYGRCDGDRFSGTDAETASVVIGRCTADGTIIATDTKTAQSVSGRCGDRR